MSIIETDYLVVGAGAASMAFTDALIAASDADVVMVDRRHHPGGHWNDAYPFVRLHQPSAYYGVNSRTLGTETIDTAGPNAGFYDRATSAEICAYYREVLEAHLLPSGMVRFLGGHDYTYTDGEHVVTSRLTGQPTTVRVKRKVVDGTYLETSVPATHSPSFSVDPDAQLIPPGRLVDLGAAPTGYTVIGAGKTAMDTCNWLLENGIDPDRIRWIRPRDSWLLNRAMMQPLDGVVQMMEGFAIGVEAIIEADDLDDLLRRLESSEQVFRIDPAVTPTMFRGATISETEVNALRQIERVVRHGKVRQLETGRIVLDRATIDTTPREVHVDCTACGVNVAPPQAMFQPRRIILQSTMGGNVSLNAALTGHVEATVTDDIEKNRLCPPVAPPREPVDWLSMICGGHRAMRTLAAAPETRAWLSASRLNMTRGLRDRLTDPRAQAAVTRWATNLDAALRRSEELQAASRPR